MEKLKLFIEAIKGFFSTFNPATKEPVTLTGALPDTRTEEEKAGDIHFSDLVAKAAAVVWKTLDLTKLPDWPVLNQESTNACVAFTKALMASILYSIRTGIFVLFSPKWIYSFRRNKPEGGMIGVDAFDIEAVQGLVPEAMEPSEGLTEAQMNAYTAQPWEKEVGKALRMSDQRVILPTKDIDVVASVMQVTGKPVMVWFQWFYDEWVRDVPMVMRANPPYAHSVTFIPPRSVGQNSFGMYRGQKAIVIQDSWGLDKAQGTINGKRIITEDFYKSRNFFAAYSMRFKFDEAQGARPVYDGTIISLQKCLRFEGFFPSNVDYVESLGPVTKKSIASFQQKYSLSVTGQLDAATVAKVKAFYTN